MTVSPGPGPEAQFARSSGRAVSYPTQPVDRTAHFLPRVVRPGSGESDLEWVTASGMGTVHAITVNRSKDPSYNIASSSWTKVRA
jgi:hypothetical protein